MVGTLALFMTCQRTMWDRASFLSFSFNVSPCCCSVIFLPDLNPTLIVLVLSEILLDFFFSPWFSLLFDFIYSLSIKGSSHILMSSRTGCLLRMLFPCGTLKEGCSVSPSWDSVSVPLIIHMYILGITSPPSWLNLSLDVYANRLGVSTVDTFPYHCLPS